MDSTRIAKTSKARPAKQRKRGQSLSPDQIEMHRELAKLRQASYKAAADKLKPKT